MASYTVKLGDTLTAIAARLHTSVEALAKANGIADPNYIQVGQVLDIPAPPTPHPAPAAETPGETETHVVQPGENLTEIAKEMDTTVPTIVADDHIPDPNLIHPGEVISVPEPPGVDETGPDVEVTPEPAPASGGFGAPTAVYVVKPGDTLTSIAGRFGTDVAAILGDNHIPNPDLIYPGQRLSIPSLLGHQETMYDSVDAYKIPSGAAMVAGYIDGKYAWSDAEWNLFPNARKLRITVTGVDGADVVDVEKGDVSNGGVVGWVTRNPGKLVYTSAFNVQAVKSALGTLSYQLWVADWTNEPHLYPGSVITQWTSSPAGYDVSEVSSSF